MNFLKLKEQRGLTIIETLVSLSMFVIVSFLLSSFIRSVFFINTDLSNSLSAQFDARQMLKKIVSELRSASPSSLGAYPISLASTSTITFYSDLDNDGLKEKVRYFLQGKTFRRGVVKPSGSPLVYNDASETLSTVADSVSNATNTPIFDYFDENYTGTSSPLGLPINVLAVRLVRITFVIEKDSNRLPAPFTASTQVSLRNLKDNL